MVLGRTQAVFSKLLSDIRSIIYWTNIVIQSILLNFYVYSLYRNLNNLAFFITYSVLSLTAIVSFIIYIISYNKTSSKLTKLNKRLKILKYIVNTTIIGLNLYEIMSFNTTALAKLLFAISIISLIIQILLELIKMFIEKYVGLFTSSLEKDLEFLRLLDKGKEFKGNFYQVIDAPLQLIANKIENKKIEQDSKEQYVDQLFENHKEKKKEEIKQRSEENAKKQKREIKEHLHVIKNGLFKKK